MSRTTKELILKHFVKRGEFVLRDGSKSSNYFDFRELIGHPKILDLITNDLTKMMTEIKPELIAGLPYASLPIATVISVKSGVPMIYRRKEIKDYGTKKDVEGIYEKGQKVLIVDDVITSGGSKKEIIEALIQKGLIIIGILVIVDRRKTRGDFEGVPVYSLFLETDFDK